MRQHHPIRYHPPRNKKKRRITISLVVLAVLVLVLLLVAIILSLRYSAATVSSVAVSVDTAPVIITASAPVSSRYVPPAVGPYDEEGIPLLCNAQRLIPEEYFDTMELADVGDGRQMAARAAQAFADMRAAAAAEGIDLYPYSCWRSHTRQQNNFDRSVQRYLSQGYSDDEALRLTMNYYALPGSSEHEAGLAVDIDGTEESFERTEDFAWLQQHSAEYGFILRYHADTYDITGIAYEPWHYRYVGTNHAKAMQDLGYTTLEEYVMMLESQEA